MDERKRERGGKDRRSKQGRELLQYLIDSSTTWAFCVGHISMSSSGKYLAKRFLFIGTVVPAKRFTSQNRLS